jgi:hypothetical protein
MIRQWWIVYRKWCEKKWWWPNWRYSRSICLEELRRITKIVSIVCAPAEILTWHLLHISQKCYHLSHFAQYKCYVEYRVLLPVCQTCLNRFNPPAFLPVLSDQLIDSFLAYLLTRIQFHRLYSFGWWDDCEYDFDLEIMGEELICSVNLWPEIWIKTINTTHTVQ